MISVLLYPTHTHTHICYDIVQQKHDRIFLLSLFVSIILFQLVILTSDWVWVPIIPWSSKPHAQKLFNAYFVLKGNLQPRKIKKSVPKFASSHQTSIKPATKRLHPNPNDFCPHFNYLSQRSLLVLFLAKGGCGDFRYQICNLCIFLETSIT